ncbi:MAG TPA: N-acetylmuramoyl-L-alanine amidase [Bacilli bacterium]|nr:N-acetylmuramoyl-L-alanine amidase [Bacilli bacterium]
MKRHRAYFRSFRFPLTRLGFPLLLAVLLLFPAFFLISTHHPAHSLPHNGPVTVMIDPGHGGYDPGVLTDDVHEAQITLAVAKKVHTLLLQKGISAGMTRTTDTDYAEKGMRGSNAKRTDLAARLSITELSHAKLFVSLHANESSLATRGGAEVYYNEVQGAKELAELIQNNLHQLPDMSKRNARTGTYYLLRNQKIPALIIECGYLNFHAERARLQSPAYQEKIAQAVADGIESYLKQTGQLD